MTKRSSMLHVIGVAVLALGILLGCSGSDMESTDASESTDLDVNSEVPGTGLDELDPGNPVGETGDGPRFHPEANPEFLSSWGQLEAQGGSLRLADRVTPYTLNSALFSDHAQKLRTVWLPEGTSPGTYEEEDVLSMPVGTVITKTFYYSLADGSTPDALRVSRRDDAGTLIEAPLDLATTHLVETRVLAHREAGWVALPYVWNSEQTDATLSRTGDLVQMTLVAESGSGDTDLDFPYLVPNVNQCAGCHATNHTTKQILPIGPKARHLNTDVDIGNGVQSQLEQWTQLGLLTGLPPISDVPKTTVWNDDSASLNDRARAYLDINCSHCHNQNGPADTSGLFLERSTDLGPRLGVCKLPVAAGTGTGDRRVGIHPGEPDDSIFVFRMQSSDPGAMMPELGRAIVHQEGVDLIAEWIESLDGGCS